MNWQRAIHTRTVIAAATYLSAFDDGERTGLVVSQTSRGRLVCLSLIFRTARHGVASVRTHSPSDTAEPDEVRHHDGGHRWSAGVVAAVTAACSGRLAPRRSGDRTARFR